MITGRILAGYYAVVLINDISTQNQQLHGWLFVIKESEGGAPGMLAALTPSDIEWSFVFSVIPQILTILFLAMLYASMALTGLKAPTMSCTVSCTKWWPVHWQSE